MELSKELEKREDAVIYKLYHTLQKNEGAISRYIEKAGFDTLDFNDSLRNIKSFRSYIDFQVDGGDDDNEADAFMDFYGFSLNRDFNIVLSITSEDDETIGGYIDEDDDNHYYTAKLDNDDDVYRLIINLVRRVKYNL